MAEQGQEDKLGDGAGGNPGHPGDSLRYDVTVDLSNTNHSHTQLILLAGENKKVLEVGPATGYITEVLQRRNCRVTAIEIDPIAAEKAAQFCERIIVGDVERIDVASILHCERFDVIMFGDVLEHLVDPQRVLSEVSRLLQPNGYVVASIPNVAHGSIRLALLRGEFRYSERGLLDRTHLRFFTSESVEELFRVAGYTIETWQRTIVDTFATEHQLRESEYPPRLVAALRQDPEALTYQFVVKASLVVQPEASTYTFPAAKRTSTILEALWEKASGSPLDALLAERDRLQSQLAAKDKLIADANFQLLAIQRTISWKALERLRRVRDRLLPPDTWRRKAYWAFRRVVEVLLEEGLQACFRKAGHKIRQACRGQGVLVIAPPQDIPQDLNAQYKLWLKRHRLTSRAIAQMKAAVETFTYNPLISIVTPVYNPDEAWLRKAIESVRGQIYPYWELCLVNDDSTNSRARPILDEYAAADPRIRVKCLSHIAGVVGASTHALNLAKGEFVSLLGHNDELAPDALFEVVKRLNEDPHLDFLYSDEDKLELDGRRVEPFFKPDWSPDLLLSMNYITQFSVFRRSILVEIGGFRAGFDGSEDYDLLLRFTEKTDKIAHIPKILYHWRKTPGSAAASEAAKQFAYEAGRRAVEDALRRRGYEALVNISPGFCTIRYRLRSTPLVSIIVPTRDRWELLQECLRSVEENTGYTRYEIIVLDNGSTEPETLKYLDAIATRCHLYRCPGPFNFSAINNFGASKANGDYLLFLNNDTQVIRSDWLTAMLEQAQRPEVGAVGARLLYPDGRIQHAGVVLGIGGLAGHAFKGLPGNSLSYFGFADLMRNCSAVTAACMMVPRRAFEEVRGFDERFRVGLNDVDFCLRLRQRGYLIVYTPLALLYHHEYGTREPVHPPEDGELFWKVWGDLIKRGDPYYNPNLTLSREDWSLRLWPKGWTARVAGCA